MSDFNIVEDVNQLGNVRSTQIYYPKPDIVEDGYNVWGVTLVPDQDTKDIKLVSIITGHCLNPDYSTADAHCVLEVDGQRINLRDFHDHKFEDYNFTFVQERYYNYLNGKSVRFIVKEKNKLATVFTRSIYLERFF